VVVLATQALHIGLGVGVAALVEWCDVVEFFGEPLAAFTVLVDPCAERVSGEDMLAASEIDPGAVDGSALLVTRSLPASCAAVALIGAVVLCAFAAPW
jgi:hypothetical protein